MNKSEQAPAGAGKTSIGIERGRIGSTASGARARHRAGLSAEQRALLVHLMLERDGLAGACVTAGVKLGVVLAERRRNPAFRRALEAAEQQRHALLQMLLTDLAVRGLLPDEDDKPKGEAREKFLSGLAQALVERANSERAGGKAASSAVEKPVKRGRGAASRALPGLPIDGDELDRLLAETEKRIAAAEAELKDPGKDPDKGPDKGSGAAGG